MHAVLPFLIGGLVFFLHSITQLSQVMKSLFSDQARAWVLQSTGSTLKAVLWGTVLTILLGSSSAVIILAIVFINSEALDFKRAMGIIMGANVGTTFSSQIIALDIGQYAVIPMIIGLVIAFIARSERGKLTGQVLLYFGMLFFGLFLMEESVLPLRDSSRFTNWMTFVAEKPLQGALVGGLVTLIIQSSSGTVGMAIVLAKQGLLGLGGGIAIMLGAELGTCSDTLLATIKGSRQALKAGIFHLFFNLVSIILGLLLFVFLVDSVLWISPGASVSRQIANAHVFFNVAGVLLFLPFLGHAKRFLDRLLPDSNTPG